jgi:hypothetical protein
LAAIAKAAPATMAAPALTATAAGLIATPTLGGPTAPVGPAAPPIAEAKGGLPLGWRIALIGAGVVAVAALIVFWLRRRRQ